METVTSKYTSLRSNLYQLLHSVYEVEQFTLETSGHLRQEIHDVRSSIQTSHLSATSFIITGRLSLFVIYKTLINNKYVFEMHFRLLLHSLITELM